jgi:hypothetical protein
VRGQRERDEQGGERQIHAVFGDRLGDERDETGTGCEDKEETGAKKTASRFSEEGPNGQAEQRQHDQCLPPNVGK